MHRGGNAINQLLYRKLMGFIQIEKKKCLKALVVVVLLQGFLFLNGQSFSGLDPDKNLRQYILKSWGTEQGLSSESTNALMQGADGYLWIGTYTGMHRFDGNRIEKFSPQNSNLPSRNILTITKDTSNALWMGTLHGVCKLEDRGFIIPDPLTEINDFSIEDICATIHGDIWISTKSNHIFRLSKDTLTEFTANFNVENNTVLAIAGSPDGTVYIGTDDSRMYSYNQGQITQVPIPQKVNGIYQILVSNEKVYVGTGMGLFEYHNNTISKLDVLHNTTITSLLDDQHGNLWMGTMRGLFRYNLLEQSLDSLTEKQGLPNNIIRDLVFDGQGNLWGGTYRKGFFQLSDGSITSYSKNDGLSSNVITAITEIAENKYILGDEVGNLNLAINGEVYPYRGEIPLPKARLKHLYTDRQNRIWASTYEGLVLLDDKNSKLYSIENGFPDNFIRHVFQDKNDNIWVGTKNAGLIKMEGLSAWKVINTDDGLSSNYIMSIDENGKGQLVVGTISGANIIEHEKVIKTIMLEDGLPSNFMFATYSTPNYLWIASNDGLTRYSDEKTIVFNTENGLPSNIIYDIIPDNEGNLWLPSEKSIIKVNLKDLEDAIEVDNDELSEQQFDKSHGMKNNHCLGGVHSFKDSAGDLWIPTLGGVAFINTDDITKSELDAKLIIENIIADGQHLPINRITHVPPNTTRLSIEFTGIDLQNSDKLQFRYKLEPFDKSWMQTDGIRNALYTNLPTGNYTFHLQVGINGVFEEQYLKREIVIHAAWWQTIWAKIGFIIVIISFSIAVYFFSMNALRSQNKRLEVMVKDRTAELENQKEELTLALENLSNAQERVVQSEKMASLGVLAAGVAHEINNPLNFIQGGYVGLADYFEEHKPDNIEDIPILLESIQEGIERAATIVASLNEFSHQSDENYTNCNLHKIIDNCLVMLRNNFKDRVELTRNYSDVEPLILGNSGKLHQAFLNILTNAEHSIADIGEISISTSIHNEFVSVEIRDTGEGIDSENLVKITDPFFTTKEPGRGTGLGLSITYTIISEHSGFLTFSSERGKGTTVVIELPLKVD